MTRKGWEKEPLPRQALATIAAEGKTQRFVRIVARKVTILFVVLPSSANAVAIKVLYKTNLPNLFVL